MTPLAALAWALASGAFAADGPQAVQGLLQGFAASAGVSVPAAPPVARGAPVTPPPQTSAGPGLRLIYIPAKKAENKKYERLLRRSKIFEDNVETLNAQLALPIDLPIEVRECGEANAWYHPDEHKIVFCYEELADAARLLKARVEPASAADRLALGDALHTLYHELGHALIDIFQLPAVGREEDAADQFATLSLLGAGDGGEVAALVTAMQFLQSGTEDRHLPFWDEHSFDKQRYFDTLCLIYGKDPEKHKDLVGPKTLPAERAERCPDEYEKLDRAWDTLLAPHLKAAPPR
jgi:hypothetical protein